jgi:hypothetical protein
LICSVAVIRLLCMVGRKLPPRGPVCECMMGLSPACRTEQNKQPSQSAVQSVLQWFSCSNYIQHTHYVFVSVFQAHQLGVPMIPLMMESDYAAKGGRPCVTLPRCMCHQAQLLAEC